MEWAQLGLIMIDDAFDRFFDDWGNQGLDRFDTEFWKFVAAERVLQLMTIETRIEQRQVSRSLIKWVGSHRYARARRKQLEGAGFALWIFRTSGECHEHLDGMVLESSHSFWSIRSDGSEVGCRCWVSGARDLKAAQRRGARLEIQLRAQDPRTVPIDGFSASAPLAFSDCLVRLDRLSLVTGGGSSVERRA